MASIKSTINNKPSPYDLYSAASYYLQEGEDLKIAKQWISKAVKIDSSKYWMFRQQALILNELNENKKAIIAAKKGLELAKKAGNKDHIRMNIKSIKEWKK
jgi:Tfp pilus assembly protein PilF